MSGREELLDALLLERYAPPPPPPGDTSSGPSYQWALREKFVADVRRLYHDQHLPTDAVARTLRVPWHVVVGVVEGWTS